MVFNCSSSSGQYGSNKHWHRVKIKEGYYNIYHIVLEDDNNYYNYGIYANGILTESTMENTLSKLNNYDLINVDKSMIENNAE